MSRFDLYNMFHLICQKCDYQFGKKHNLSSGEIKPSYYKMVFESGLIHWYKDLLIHKEDGPAVIFNDGSTLWFIEGKQVDCFTQEEFEKSVEYREWKLKIFS
jgi:hypothetical protein